MPQELVTDNGPEFAGQALGQWAHRRGIRLRFITPGRPVENACVESFNGKFRVECLNEHRFVSLPDARQIIESYRIDYNQVRAAQLARGRTPEEFGGVCDAPTAFGGLRSANAAFDRTEPQ